MAKNILRDLKPEEYFFVHDGAVIRDIRELPAALKKMDESSFRYHHNPQIDDFANWIRFLSDDLEFVAKIRKCLTKDEMIKVVEQEISSVEKVAAAVKLAQKKEIGALVPAEKEKAAIAKPAKAKKKAIRKKKPKKEKAKPKKERSEKKKPKEHKKLVKLRKDILKIKKDIVKRFKNFVFIEKKPVKKAPKKAKPEKKKPKEHKKLAKLEKEIIKTEKDVLKRIRNIGKKKILWNKLKDNLRRFRKTLGDWRKKSCKKCKTTRSQLYSWFREKKYLQYLEGGIREYLYGIVTGMLLAFIILSFI